MGRFTLITHIFLFICFCIPCKGADSCDQRILKDLDDVKERAICSDLPMGKSMIVNFDSKTSPTAVPLKYELSRVSPDKYKVRLNLKLQENTLLGRRDTNLTKKMRSKIQQCLQWINPHLIGPENKSFEIELIDSPESDQKKYAEIENWISVSEKKLYRENSGLYSLQSSCPIIAHELLHLLGLVDEYKESEDISWTEQDCRSLGPPDSIMVHEKDGTDSDSAEFPQKILALCCVCKDRSCTKKTNSEISSLKACPSDYTLEKHYTKFTAEAAKNTDSNLSCISNDFTGMNNPKVSFLLSAGPTARIQNSFLYPAQFKAITSPGCKEKNRIYYSCARDSKFRPFKFIGSCNTKPTICQDGEEWLK